VETSVPGRRPARTVFVPTNGVDDAFAWPGVTFGATF
jgi:hypothetical protein